MQPARAILSSPWVFAGLVASALLGLLLARPLGRLFKKPAVLAALTVISVASIVVVTLYPTGSDGPAGSWCLSTLATLPTLGVFRTQNDALLNVVLFVPAGVLGALLARKPVLVFLVLAVLSFAIELTQGWLGDHSCSNDDLWANAAGAMLGSAAGGALAAIAHGCHRDCVSSSSSS